MPGKAGKGGVPHRLLWYTEPSRGKIGERATRSFEARTKRSEAQ